MRLVGLSRIVFTLLRDLSEESDDGFFYAEKQISPTDMCLA